MLKLQYFGHLMQRDDMLENILMLGKTEGIRRRGATKDEMVGWHHQLNGHEFKQTQGDNKGVLQSMGLQRVRHGQATERQLQITECLSLLKQS